MTAPEDVRTTIRLSVMATEVPILASTPLNRTDLHRDTLVRLARCGAR